jgi:hypothetical protein
MNLILGIGCFMDYLFVGISPPYFATTLRYEEKKTTKER